MLLVLTLKISCYLAVERLKKQCLKITATRKAKHVIITKIYVIFSKKFNSQKYVNYRGKGEDYMFSKHVIFSPDKLHVRLHFSRLHMESRDYMFQLLN